MDTDWLFYAAAVAFAIGVLGYLLGPLLRSGTGPERRSSYDMQVYRDQLREIDTDLGRGIVTMGEAAAVRTEISRRLLAAADAESVETAASGAPRRATLAVTGVIVLVVGLGGAALYADLGAPGLPDQPLGERLASLNDARANRPSQAVVEARFQESRAPLAEPPVEDLALLGQLRAVLEDRPDDVEGHRLLARSEASLGRWAEASVAQARVVAILGGLTTADDLVDLAEYMVIAAGGYVSPEAEAHLTRALGLAADNPVARYYSGLALLQGGRPDLALPLWTRLLAEGPQDAPWIGPIASQIDDVAAAAGQPAPDMPTRTQIEAQQEAQGAADNSAMIEGMVSQLSDRLATEGGPPADWARLIRSLGVLGRTEDATGIFREAHEVFAADPEALVLLRATAVAAGVEP